MTAMAHEGTIVARRRRHRNAESGQVLVLFLLIFTTMILIGTVAVVMGQVLVRRQQAQMVVDAAAFAGASKQAEGLNTIANLNRRSLELLRAIQLSNLFPRFDDASTSAYRASSYPDWAGDVLKSYQGIFDFYNGAITVANCAYSPLALPHLAARDVVNKNFGSSPNSLFVEKDKGFHAPLSVGFTLVKLTKPTEYEISPHWYLPNLISGPGSISTCVTWPAGTALCIATYARYAIANGIHIAAMIADPIKYEMGRFYDNDEGNDVRFAYYLEVSQSPVIFGRNFFSDIPPIIVAAAAKPYGGYLGNEYIKSGVVGEPNAVIEIGDDPDEEGNAQTKTKNIEVPDSGNFFQHGSKTGETIKLTYRAKLVPLNGAEKAKLVVVAAANGSVTADLEGLRRWDPLTILH